MTETCQCKLKTGARAGRACGAKAKSNGFCGRHATCLRSPAKKGSPKRKPPRKLCKRVEAMTAKQVRTAIRATRARMSPKRRSPSPKRRSPSPKRRSPSPKRRSPSPKRRSPSPKRPSLKKSHIRAIQKFVLEQDLNTISIKEAKSALKHHLGTPLYTHHEKAVHAHLKDFVRRKQAMDSAECRACVRQLERQ